MQVTTEATIERYILDEIMFGKGQKRIAPDQSLLDTGILDSLALLRLIVFIEEQFGITVGDDEVTPVNFDSLDKIKSYVDGKLQS
jgi:acyl carrier protein